MNLRCTTPHPHLSGFIKLQSTTFRKFLSLCNGCEIIQYAEPEWPFLQ